MTEFSVGPGDPVSQLVQVIAREVGFKDWRWIGKGRDDIRALILELHNTRVLKDGLWKGVLELTQMKEVKELPEAMQAQIMGIILTIRANAELQKKVYVPPPSPPGAQG